MYVYTMLPMVLDVPAPLRAVYNLDIAPSQNSPSAGRLYRELRLVCVHHGLINIHLPYLPLPLTRTRNLNSLPRILRVHIPEFIATKVELHF